MLKRMLFAAFSLIIIIGLLVVANGATLVVAQGGTPAATMAAVPGSGMITGPMDGEAKALSGAGSTFAVPLYTKWFSDYATLTGVKVNYQGIGSGGGIKGIQDQTLDFGATDGPMTDDQLKTAKGGPILHIPTALGGVVVTYNVPEATDPIKFTGETLALIYLGNTAANFKDKDGKALVPLLKWNDARLVADNPQLKDVDRLIFVVHRSDGSGTTNIFTSFLSSANPDTWGKKESSAGAGDGGPGAANAVSWPTGLGGQGSAGVSGLVRQSPYTIGYVELAYAQQNTLPIGLVKNKAGKFMSPASADAVSSAAAGVTLPDDMRVKIVNADGDNAYPIAGFTWVLVYQNQTDAAKATAIARLLWWGTHDGQAVEAGLGYAPLPDAAIKKTEALILKISVNGKQALPDGIAK